MEVEGFVVKNAKSKSREVIHNKFEFCVKLQYTNLFMAFYKFVLEFNTYTIQYLNNILTF